MIELETGSARAAIDSERGFACARFSVADWPVLGGGMHVEFPWVGARPARSARLRTGSVQFEVGGGPADTLAAHGWILEPRADVPRARLRTDPATSAYPFELELLAEWRLDAESLRLELELVNRSKRHAPFGIGVRADLAPLGGRVQVLAPAEQYAVVGGKEIDLRRPMPVEQHIHVSLTRRHFANLQTQLAVLGQNSNREVWLNTSADFREAELSIGPDGSGTLASATCIPDAFARHADGVTTGLRVLAPGEAWRGHALLVAGVHCEPDRHERE